MLPAATGSTQNRAKRRSDHPRAEPKSRKRYPVHLKIARGILDLSLVSALMRNWIVPQLVNEFLAASPVVTAAVETKSTSESLGMEDARRSA